jgi:hypothetical protein
MAVGFLLRERFKAQRLLQDGEHVSLLINGIVRVVESDPTPQVAMSLVQTFAQDPCACLNIRAEIVPQSLIGRCVRCAPMRRDHRNPDLVDLHRSDIDRAVGCSG